MFTGNVYRLLVCIALLAKLAQLSGACPAICKCGLGDRERGRGKLGGGNKARRQMDCTNKSLVRPLSPDVIPRDTVLLDFSNNTMKTIRGGAFTGLDSVQTL
ncbi:adhesion G protein-coupled receptor A3-like [Lytechinus variegatus]|uniref:adhesion G protein-coupled receptor A3-like n=1 Tax=Lytechinus variegatus TaxID=7654 RepID=UPI001BB1BC2A|nr:adhesion G protein-coupled receptor A3-like [Lytechinus variegatus]